MAKTLGILELNDFQLQLSLLEDNRIAEPIDSCGYATINTNKQSIQFGSDAQQQFRRQPLTSYNQYWNQLNVDPIDTRHNKLRHFADFAHQQLLDLHNQANFDQLIIAVPASFNNEQLSLLLGICGQCPFEVVGLVDSAVLSCINGRTDNSNEPKSLHLDIQLHQCLLTHLTNANANQSQSAYTQINNADIIPGTGISQLYAKLAHYLSEQFIEQCRFDPIHNADSEQLLYNLLEQLINGDKSHELQLSLQGKQITLNRQSIWRHANDLFDEVINTIEKSAPFDILYVHQRITTIDSLYQRLTDKFAGKIQVIEQQAIVSNISEYQAQILASDKGLQYTTRLIKGELTQQPKFARASHLLIKDYAYPIGEQTIYFGASSASLKIKDDSLIAIDSNQSLSILKANTVEINGQAASNNHALNLGDTLTVNDQKARLINVLPNIEHEG